MEIIAQTFVRMLYFDTKKLVFLFQPEKFMLSNNVDIYWQGSLGERAAIKISRAMWRAAQTLSGILVYYCHADE